MPRDNSTKSELAARGMLRDRGMEVEQKKKKKNRH